MTQRFLTGLFVLTALASSGISMGDEDRGEEATKLATASATASASAAPSAEDRAMEEQCRALFAFFDKSGEGSIPVSVFLDSWGQLVQICGVAEVGQDGERLHARASAAGPDRKITFAQFKPFVTALVEKGVDFEKVKAGLAAMSRT